MSLKGKLAIVTISGKANGIGFAIATELAQLGADVVLHYNSNKEAALQSVKAVKLLNVKAIAVQSDATSLTFGEDIISAVTSALPSQNIDIIVNNSAVAIFLF